MFLLADWMSNPFDRVVCGDFAGKNIFDHYKVVVTIVTKDLLIKNRTFFLKNPWNMLLMSIIYRCQQTIKIRNI